MFPKDMEPESTTLIVHVHFSKSSSNGFKRTLENKCEQLFSERTHFDYTRSDKQAVVTNSVAQEPEGSSPHTQQPVTGPCPELVESNPPPPPPAQSQSL
jgi:hypothetical protein